MTGNKDWKKKKKTTNTAQLQKDTPSRSVFLLQEVLWGES